MKRVLVEVFAVYPKMLRELKSYVVDEDNLELRNALLEEWEDDYISPKEKSNFLKFKTNFFETESYWSGRSGYSVSIETHSEKKARLEKDFLDKAEYLGISYLSDMKKLESQFEKDKLKLAKLFEETKEN